MSPKLTHITSAVLPTRWAEFVIHIFKDSEQREYTVLALGTPEPGQAVLSRVHSSCLTGEVMGSLRCDCGPQLIEAQRRIAEQGLGLLLYLPQEGRGIGLSNKIRAYNLQDRGEDTVTANLKLGFASDMRNYAVCVSLFDYFGVTRLRLMTNNPRKVQSLQLLGFDVVERVPLVAGDSNIHRERYLQVKKEKLGHLL